MHTSIQNRSDLYKMIAPLETPNIIPQGIHAATLIEVRRFAGAFGERVGLVFEITQGSHKGCVIMESATLKTTPKGKFAELVRGMGGEGSDLLAVHELIGRACKIAVRHEQNREGKRYAAITQTYP